MNCLLWLLPQPRLWELSELWPPWWAPVGHDAPLTVRCGKSDRSDTTHRALSLSLAKSQPEKSEATSDNEGDPAHPHRYRPVADDDGPLQLPILGTGRPQNACAWSIAARDEPHRIRRHSSARCLVSRRLPEASANFECQAVGTRSVGYGRAYFVTDAKRQALIRCERRSGVCIISYCARAY